MKMSKSKPVGTGEEEEEEKEKPWLFCEFHPKKSCFLSLKILSITKKDGGRK